MDGLYQAVAHEFVWKTGKVQAYDTDFVLRFWLDGPF